MILGIGTDIVNIKRIEKAFKKYKEKLFQKILTKKEIEKLNKIKNINDSKNQIVFCAKRFAAKEAFAKALGIGIGRGINFTDITVTNDIMGKPIIELSDKANEFIKNHYKKKDTDNLKINISISDDYPVANAVVIISE